ncbi:MAG: tetratricopeptide repeat protein [Sandaracinaceae bacterium]
MARNPRRSGLIDARDRARKRRREHRAPHGLVPDETERLNGWLDTHLEGQPLSVMERLDLRALLRATVQYDVPAEERLRQLAIAIESRVLFESPMRAWSALDRIYLRALRLGPSELRLHASRAASAFQLSEWAEHAEVAARLRRRAAESLSSALKLAPADGELHYLAGLLRYTARGDLAEALAQFERAVELDPSHAFAWLYRAHCLHDQERFAEAVVAYSEVPQHSFRGVLHWRAVLLVEQRAQCRARSGDLEGARSDFERLLTRYEAEPHLIGDVTQYRHWAIQGPFPDLAERVRRIEASRK